MRIEKMIMILALGFLLTGCAMTNRRHAMLRDAVIGGLFGAGSGALVAQAARGGDTGYALGAAGGLIVGALVGTAIGYYFTENPAITPR